MMLVVPLLALFALPVGAADAPTATATTTTTTTQTTDATGHPGPQPRNPPPVNTIDGDWVIVDTPQTFFPEPEVDAFAQPPGTNFLPTVYTNMFDGAGVEMPNTLPSTPHDPYHLHPDPDVRPINVSSPTNDLERVFTIIDNAASAADAAAAAKLGVAILVGAEVDTRMFGRSSYIGLFPALEGEDEQQKKDRLTGPRAYEGFPLLHIAGPNKIKKVTCKGSGEAEVCSVTVRQVWYDQHIESDTAFVDPTAALEKPWTVNYEVAVMDRGEDDFSPFAIYVDDPALTDPEWKSHLPGRGRLHHVGMDQSFFPMEDGTQVDFEIGMPPGKYLHLVYTWGWRYHPPRIQAYENALKHFPPYPAPDAPASPMLKRTDGQTLQFDGADVVPGRQPTLPEWEAQAFGVDEPKPIDDWATYATNNPTEVDRRIQRISDLSPARIMYEALRGGSTATAAATARAAWLDWRDRLHLPSGVEPDPDADMTLLYVNNTLYGEFRSEMDHAFQEVRFHDWKLRGDDYSVKLINGDRFQHAYVNVDFGGARGWENQFKSSTKVGGSGCWFTFGRAHWQLNSKPVVLPPAGSGRQRSAADLPSQYVRLNWNFEPSTRLRFYQFDPMHHDVAIFSIH